MIHERIKLIRKTLKLSQTEFGKYLDKKLRTVQSWESGYLNVSDGVLFRLQEVFNVNPDWVKTGNGDMFLMNNPDNIKFDMIDNQIVLKKINELRGQESVNSFCKKIGLNQSSFNKFLNGQLYSINLDSLVKISQFYKVPLDFFVNDAAYSHTMSFNPELLELIIDTLEELFVKENLHLQPMKKAKLIRLLYEHLSSKIDKDKLENKVIHLQDYFDYDTAKTFVKIAGDF